MEDCWRNSCGACATCLLFLYLALLPACLGTCLSLGGCYLMLSLLLLASLYSCSKAWRLPCLEVLSAEHAALRKKHAGRPLPSFARA